MSRDSSVYDTKLHSSVVCRQLYPDGHHQLLEEHACKHSKKKKKNKRQKKVYMGKGGKFYNLEPIPSRIGSEGDYYRLYSTQWARRRPSVAGQCVLGVRAEGFCGCGAA